MKNSSENIKDSIKIPKIIDFASDLLSDIATIQHAFKDCSETHNLVRMLLEFLVENELTTNK